MSAFDRRWLAVFVVPVGATVIGLAALPRPHGVGAEQVSVDRAALRDVVSTTPTTPARPLDATLGGLVRIRGADLPVAAVSRGARLPLKIHFGVVDALADDWQVFVHIDADEGGFRINADHWPARGSYRTTLWQKGEFVVDAFDALVPPAAPSGTYTVWVGLYRGDKRLPFSAGDQRLDDGEDRIKLGAVVIE